MDADLHRGIVTAWHDEDGWGVLESPATPGGCFVHYAALRMAGYKLLVVGTEVHFEFEPARQDGYRFWATAVWPPGVEPGSPDPAEIETAGAAYRSSLSIDLGARSPVRVFRAAGLAPADPTPGMERSLAFELPLLWAGQVVTQPGTTSGWHHHDANDSSLYVVSGIFRFEFEGRAEPLDAGPGDFVHVPSYTIHRESNPTDEPAKAVIARVGGGIPTVNVGEAPLPHR